MFIDNKIIVREIRKFTHKESDIIVEAGAIVAAIFKVIHNMTFNISVKYVSNKPKSSKIF